MTWHDLDSGDSATQITLRDLAGRVGGVVVDQVDLDTLVDQVLQTALDKPLFVMGCENGDDTHG